MNLRHIENVIDSIDPYSLVKEMGLTILDERAPDNLRISNANKRGHIASDLIAVVLRNKLIRILPNGFLNLDIYKNNDVNDDEPFIAGTVIDFLAYYMGSPTEMNYDQAFKLFFSYYSHYLKDKLCQEPLYLEKLVKPNFIKRQNILRFIVKHLFLADSYVTPTVLCKMWAARHGIQSIAKYGFYFTSKDVFNMLMFFSQNIINDFYEQYKKQDSSNSSNFRPKVDPEAQFSDFINNHLFSESKEWVVIPYFSDFHVVSALKFINPHDDSYYFIRLEDTKLSFAGVYTIPGKINYSGTKIRLLESIEDAAILSSYAKKLFTLDELIYLGIDFSPSGVSCRSNFNNWQKPMFLYAENSNLPLIRAIFDSLSTKNTINADLYVCNYKNYKEDTVSYTYEAFVEREFKKIILDAYLGQDSSSAMNNTLLMQLSCFINACDLNNLENTKKRCLNWLLQNGFTAVYKKLSEIKAERIEFKNYFITAGSNGYICEYKSAESGETTAISNFIFKIEQNVIFPDKDTILHLGKMIMGDLEYPLEFCKHDLKKHGEAIEQIALKAFAKVTNIILDNQSVEAESGYMMPTIFDNSFNNALYTIIKHEVARAPSKYGVVNLGWDKVNNVFNAPSWQASSLKLSNKSQYIYQICNLSAKDSRIKNDKDSIYQDFKHCFSTLSIPLNFNENENKIDSLITSDVKSIMSAIIANLYRSYLGYPTKPFILVDNLNARNLIKFLFSVFGQCNAFNICPNSRLINSGVLMIGLNNYPVYVKCDTNALKPFIKAYRDYPCIILAKSQEVEEELDQDQFYAITDNVATTKVEYQHIAVYFKSVLDNLFKWIFTYGTEEFDLPNQDIKDQNQLIDEGSTICCLSKPVETETNKANKWIKQEPMRPEEAMENVIKNLTLAQVTNSILYYPERNCYIIKRVYLPEKAYDASIPLITVLKRSQLGKLLEEHGKVHRVYCQVDKNFMEDMFKQVLTSDKRRIFPDKNINIFISRELSTEKTPTGDPLRTITRGEFIRRYNTIAKYKETIKDLSIEELVAQAL